MATKKKSAKKRTRRKTPGSLQPYGKFSGMTVASIVPLANGSTLAFPKITPANQVGDQATEGDIFRAIVNDSSSVTMAIGETQAQANSNLFKIPPNGTFTLLGPGGVGWKGDLYVKGDGAATMSTMKW